MAISAPLQHAQKRWSTRARRRRLQEFLRFWQAGQMQIAQGKNNKIIELRTMLRLWKAGQLHMFYGNPNVYVTCQNCESDRLWQHHRYLHEGCQDCEVQDCPL